MKRLFFILLQLHVSMFVAMAQNVVNLTTEHLVNPMSIDTKLPRLGWMIVSDKNNAINNIMQTGYHIIVASSKEKAERCEGDLWDTTAKTSKSQWIKYEGKNLKSNTRCYWRVQVTTNKGTTDWSDIAMWNIGLLKEADWQGQWIGLDHAMPWDVEDVHSRLSARYLRTTFNTDKPIKQATLYISGLGMYEAFINGKRIGDRVLAPIPTNYRKTVLYNCYDVTNQISNHNCIGVVLGNGRYYTMQQKKKPYKITNFGYPKLRLNLILEFADGSKKVISSNDKWKINPDGPIRSNNEYDGEIYNANKELGNWTEAEYNDSAWSKAERVAIPSGTLRGEMTNGMKVVKTLTPKSINTVGNNTIIDFGQNTAGWVKFRIPKLDKGDTIIIKYAEKLDESGRLYTANLRNAQTTDYYISNGNDEGKYWSPAFSYHGFRYIEVVNTSHKTAKPEDRKTIQPQSDFLAEVISDDMAATGSFSSGNSILNQIHHNALWGILSNYKGMPVDCPQRDERQPWLGDRTGGCFGEAFLFDNNNLYQKWNRDIVEAQREDGCIPDVAPAYWNYYSDNMTWPAALPFSMKMLYQQYGNDAAIRKHYPAVKTWLAYMKEQYGKDGLITKDKYGDWCTVPEKPELIHSQDPARQTDGKLISTAYYYKLCKTMEEFANILSLADDVAFYAYEAAKTKTAFNQAFLHIAKGTTNLPGHLLHPDSTYYGNNTVTSNILPLAFGIIDDEYVKQEVEKNIIKTILSDNKGHLCCGVIGIQWLMQELRNMGRGDIAWLLATNKDYPSWGYMTEKGATTIWELWNGDTANPAMNSGNHVMLLGDLVTWMYQDAGGIRAASPGFKEIELKPDFSVDEMDNIECSYNSIYGRITSNWKKAHGKLFWHIEIPANTTAKAYMADGTVRQLGSGIYDLTCQLPQATPQVYNIPNQLPESYAITKSHNVKKQETKGKTQDSRLKTTSSPVLCNEFLYKQADFPECHSASIVECPNGDLVATYFGGTKERNPDVCIWVSRKEKDSDTWTAPQLVADGIINDTLRYACWNPVLYQTPDGKMMLYFKIGPNVAGWTGWYCSSEDNGKTWTHRQPLQEDYLGPVKNKPILNNGRIIAPTSIEKGGWRLYFENSDDMGNTWQRTDYVKAPIDVSTGTDVQAIQPTIILLPDGRLEALCRTRSRQVGRTFSTDNGATWSELELTDIPNNNSGLDAVSLKGGGYALICNDWPIEKTKQKGDRNPLSILISKDGLSWKHWITLEDSPISQYSYPSIIQSANGHLHAVYTWRRQRIKHVELLPPAK